MREKIAARLLIFAVNIFKLEKQLCTTYSGKHVYGQLFRSGTSTGANYEEATAAESRKDFTHKMQIVLKELRESKYWISFIQESGILPKNNEILIFLSKESKKLTNIIGKAVTTTKKNNI